jgi:hypothetical protein
MIRANFRLVIAVGLAIFSTRAADACTTRGSGQSMAGLR